MAKSYPVSIVGESHYKAAVRSTREGDYVDLLIERDNPHAESGIALRVDNLDGDTVGYIPEDSWLYEAIVTEGQGCLARVILKDGNPPGLRLEVRLGDEAVPTVQYRERLHQPTGQGGCAILLAVIGLAALLRLGGRLI